MKAQKLMNIALAAGFTGGFGDTQFSRYPYNFGQTKWAREQRKKVTAMRREGRDDAGRKAAAVAKRERRKLRNVLGYGTGRTEDYRMG